MMVSVAREFKWSPGILGDLFFDDQDYKGLIFWYKDVEEMNKQLKDKSKK